jgi:hypothetical protein
MKKRVFFYKWVAAASVTFAIVCASAFYYWTSVPSKNDSIAASELLNSKQNDFRVDDKKLNNDNANNATTNHQVEPGEGNLSDGKENSVDRSSIDSQPDESEFLALSNLDETSKSGKAKTQNPGKPLLVSEPPRQESVAAPTVFSDDRFDGGFVSLRNQRLPSLYSITPVQLNLPKKEEADPGQLLLQRLAYEEKMLNAEKEKKEKQDERIWTSVGFAAGSFNNVGPGNTASAVNSNSFQILNAAQSSIANETNATGSSYSVNVNVGGRVAKRWIVQGGINYLTQSSDYSTNAVVVADQSYSAPSLAELNKNAVPNLDGVNFVTTPEYSINNNLQFFSLPVMAGYLIVDRDVGWQLNTGISTDLFIQNVVTPDNDNLSKTTNGRGDESPYRPYNFSGLIGTEFSYRVANRYRIALNPGIRYPFNSIYKSEVGIDTTPVTFDVALKFRYIFQ